MRAISDFIGGIIGIIVIIIIWAATWQEYGAGITFFMALVLIVFGCAQAFGKKDSLEELRQKRIRSEESVNELLGMDENKRKKNDVN